MERVQCAVVGGGVIGLAVARSLSARGLETVLVEASSAVGGGISSRNSEVIHAGLYYSPNSLRGKLCLEGNVRMYEFCAKMNVAHSRCGKLVVATHQDQEKALQHLMSNAKRNGVQNLKWLSGEEACEIEPELRCNSALLSTSTGIVDSHGYMVALQAEAVSLGCSFCFNTTVIGGRVNGRGESSVLQTSDGSVCADLVVNCAGLNAQRLSSRIKGLPLPPPLFLCKGSYFRFTGTTNAPFSRLIYPIPDADIAGLGVHSTLDLSGTTRFGPDTQWVDSEDDLEVDEGKVGTYEIAILKYWPGLPEKSLVADYAGIRPKLNVPGDTQQDFYISRDAPCFINLFGIDSPGLTASLAIEPDVRVVVGNWKSLVSAIQTR